MATPASLQNLARKAALTRLKGDATLSALVPVASIQPDGPRTWPFVILTTPRTLKLRASCVRGARVSFDLHAFAKPREVGGSIVESAEDHISRIAGAIETLFGGSTLTLGVDIGCSTDLTDAQYLSDDEPDAIHWFSQLNCRVLAE